MMAYEQDNHSSGNTKEAEIACYVQLIQSYPKAGMDLGRGLRGPGPKKKNQYVKFSKKKGLGPYLVFSSGPPHHNYPYPNQPVVSLDSKTEWKSQKTKEKKKKEKKRKGEARQRK